MGFTCMFAPSRSDSVPLATCGFVSGLDGVKRGSPTLGRRGAGSVSGSSTTAWSRRGAASSGSVRAAGPGLLVAAGSEADGLARARRFRSRGRGCRLQWCGRRWTAGRPAFEWRRLGDRSGRRKARRSAARRRWSSSAASRLVPRRGAAWVRTRRASGRGGLRQGPQQLPPGSPPPKYCVAWVRC